MKTILCGYQWTGCRALTELLREAHQVFVYTHDAPDHIPSMAGLCRKLNVPFSTGDISKSELPFRPDVVCSVYYRYIIKTWVIDACGGRIFNLHPSVLPKYRGCSSVTWALINGDPEAGFTYHYIDQGCDTGPIILQERVGIEEWDTQLSLYYRVMFESMKHFRKALDFVLAGAAGTPQQGEPTHYHRGCPHDGVIDPAWDIAYVERFIRAMYYPPYPGATYAGRPITTIDEFLALKAGS